MTAPPSSSENTAPAAPPETVAPHADGLPIVGPDNIEQDFPDEIDNIVPTRGYQMLPLVGLGGSAGSIGPLHKFFAAMPPESGMAFVVILHLSPEFDSSMAELLGRVTTMKVYQAEDAQKVEANCVYVIPPGKHLTSIDGHLKLTDLQPERGKRMTVDIFFRTLADTHGPHSAAIVLSGADGDGSIGIRRIKERGGLTIAQDPDEAEHNSMPRNAINTGMVDWVLEVAQMPVRLMEYQANEGKLRLPPEDGPQPASPPARTASDDEKALRDVLSFLRARTGRDFSYYKRATIVRRISRRMQVNSVTTMAEYLEFMRLHTGEAGALLADLLISVTNFFRDRDSFEALEQQIPRLFEGKSTGDAVRVWTAACATGEEAYSLAMLLHEHAGTLDHPPTIQIFATDLDEEVIATAREALYPLTISADVSEDRLRRFFIKEHRGYRVRREIRETVLFAVHDLLKDAPFSRLDLVTCRNLLIYLTRDAQKRALDIFHFALRAGGRLFLGSSESMDDNAPHYRVLDKKHRLYEQIPAPRLGVPLPIGPGTLQRALEARERTRNGPPMHGAAFAQSSAAAVRQQAELVEQRVSWEELHFKLIERFAPPSLIVDRDYEIMHVSENAGRFLHFAGGEPSFNLLKVVHPMLRVELRAALFSAAQTGAPVEAFRVPAELEGVAMLVDIRVSPAQEIAPDYLLVVFSIRENGANGGAGAEAGASAQMAARLKEAEPAVRHLERELEQMKTRLRDTVENYEASGEELKASNEELQAMNEELRSATEELETSREELQSINEELSTVNQELKGNVDDLDQANSDLSNLMAATAIPTVFLDRQLRIMRYTPSAVALFRMIPSDVGRPLTDLSHRLNYPELREDAAGLLETLAPRKREINDSEGRWFLARLLPYRDTEDRIAGMVLTLVDITENKNAELARAALAASLEQQAHTFDTTLSSIADLAYTFDRRGRFIYANRPLCDLLDRSLEEVEGRNFHELGYPPDLATRLQSQIEHVFTTRETVRDETAFTDPSGAEGYYEYIFQPVIGAGDQVEVVAGCTRIITERRRSEEALRLSEERFRSYFNLGLIGMAITAPDHGYMEANDELCAIFGYSRDELLKLKWCELTHPDDLAKANEDFDRVMSGEIDGYEREKRYIRKDGEVIDTLIAVKCLRHPDGAPNYFMVLVQDITEEKQAKAALGASQERLRLIVENAREYAIFSLDLERKVTSWNAGAERLLGWTEEEALGQTGDVIFTLEDRFADVCEQEAATALREGRAIDERWHLRKDGSRFWGSGVMMAMHDAAGQNVGLVKIFRDQTEAREAREALEESRKDMWKVLQEVENSRVEAVAANQAKDHFLAALSHELRTPLNPVLIAATSLEADLSLPEETREQLGMMRRNIELEARLIDDLLDMTMVSRGKLSLRPVETDVHALLRHTEEIVRSEVTGKSLDLQYKLEATDHHVMADPARLQQVFWNLLKNAVKFTENSGQVTVRTANANAGQVCIQVEDTGIGMTAEALACIFNAFEQGDLRAAHGFGGLGLGLSISKAIVDMHGAQLRAESAGPGRGSVFTLDWAVVARAPDAAPEAPPPGSAPAAPQAPLRLLVVEDDPATLSVMVRLLERDGHQVFPAINMRQALTIAEGQECDLVISDLGLPNGSGIQLMRKIKERHNWPGIALSGFGMEKDFRDTREAGFQAHLIKPVDMKQLRFLIATLARK